MTDAGVGGLTDIDIAGGFRHFRHKYHMGETLSVVTHTNINHNSLPDSMKSQTDTHTTSESLNNKSQKQLNKTSNNTIPQPHITKATTNTIANTNMRNIKNGINNATQPIPLLKSGSESETNTTESESTETETQHVYRDCQPFHTHQIDQYHPPTDASAADVKQWRTAVAAVMSEIRAYKQGGEALRQFMISEASKLQEVRDKLFCQNQAKLI